MGLLDYSLVLFKVIFISLEEFMAKQSVVPYKSADCDLPISCATNSIKCLDYDMDKAFLWTNLQSNTSLRENNKKINSIASYKAKEEYKFCESV